jgi:hypothetical protein
MHNSYLRLDHSAPHADVLLKGLEDAPRIVNGVWRLNVDPIPPSLTAPLTLIPSYPDLPMEKVYPRIDRTDIAEVFLREQGKGRVVYFPGISIAHFGRSSASITASSWPTRCIGQPNEDPPVVVSGPGCARRNDLAAEELDDRTPGEPYQPNVHERPFSRALACGPADHSYPPSRKLEDQRRQIPRREPKATAHSAPAPTSSSPSPPSSTTKSSPSISK